MIAKQTGYTPGTFTWFGADVHIYENHIDQVKEQLTRSPLALPRLLLDQDPGNIADYKPENIQLAGYISHPPIKAPMAV